MATAPLLVLVAANSPFATMSDLVAFARREGKKVTCGSFGNGSPSHLIGESLNKLAGLQMTHVPYTGGGAALDLTSGTLTLAILDALSMTPQLKAGRVRALALNGLRYPHTRARPTRLPGKVPGVRSPATAGRRRLPRRRARLACRVRLSDRPATGRRSRSSGLRG